MYKDNGDPQEIRPTPSVELLAGQIQQFLELMNLDCTSPHLKGTPTRIAKMYIQEIFKGLYVSPPKMTLFPVSEAPNKKGMLVETNIEFFSTCAHHFVPFFGYMHIGYIPDKHLVGLSKLARTVEYFARRPQVQEELTEQIADFLVETIKPLALGVTSEAEHLCMSMRGVQKPRHNTVYTALRGGMLDNEKTRSEFLKYIELAKLQPK